MKKTKAVLGILALVLLFSSSFNPAKTGLKEGEQAPRLSVQNVDNSFTLNSSKGKFVLVNFWAGYDAPSRMNNVRYARAIAKAENENLALVSISFDSNEKVFEETIKRDRLTPATQFHDKAGKESDIFDNYRLNKGFASYLISPEGVIIAKNPHPEHLTELICQ